MTVLGIDPGYERLGVAVLEKIPGGRERVLFSECFKTEASLDFPNRLLLVGQETERVIKKYKPSALAIENLFLNNNQKTAMRVAEVRGTILYKAVESGLAVFEYSPPEIKAAVAGDGRADKKQMIKMVKMLIKLDNTKQSDDELDAIAVALTAIARIK